MKLNFIWKEEVCNGYANVKIERVSNNVPNIGHKIILEQCNYILRVIDIEYCYYVEKEEYVNIYLEKYETKPVTEEGVAER